MKELRVCGADKYAERGKNMNLKNTYIKAAESGSDFIKTFCYCSGRQVLDEGVFDGTYITRGRNCMGQITPEGHLANETESPAEQSAFLVEINGELLTGNWEAESFEKAADESGLQGEAEVYVLKLYDSKAQTGVTVYTRLDGSDFIARWLKIENRGDKPIALTRLAPYAGMVWDHSHVPEAVPNPHEEFAVAYNHTKIQLHEGDFYFENADGVTHVFSDFGKSGWGRPAAWLRNRINGETLVCEYATSGNWELNTETVPESERAKMSMDIGMLTIPGEALWVLMPGESVESPAVHFGLFRRSDDEIVQATHAYVRNTILPPLPAGVPVMEIEANHRGYLCDKESEEGINADIDVAKQAGCELYVVDAGWYGWGEVNRWWGVTGDWQAGPWLKNGLEPVSQHAHDNGMRFGLWAEIEACGRLSKLHRDHPDWSISRYGETFNNGCALDLANPEVENFCYSEISRMVEQYKLDMYRLDHNHNTGLGGTREVNGFTENTSWHYYEAFKRIFKKLRVKYPGLVLQNCASGGGRLDWGTMSLFHNAELSDWMRLPRGMRSLSGVTMSLPPEILLRTFGTETGNMMCDGDLAAQLMGCMICRPIFRGIAPDLDSWSPYLKDMMAHHTGLFKNFIRPLMENCLVYHHTPFQPVMVPATLTVLEYVSADKNKGLIAAFSGNGEGAGEHIIYPRGVDRGAMYLVTFDSSGESAEVNGFELRNNGLRIRLAQAQCSELVMFERI